MYTADDIRNSTLTKSPGEVGVLIRLGHIYRKPDQGTSDIMNELRALTQEDRAWFAAELNAMGIPTAKP